MIPMKLWKVITTDYNPGKHYEVRSETYSLSEHFVFFNNHNNMVFCIARDAVSAIIELDTETSLPLYVVECIDAEGEE